MPDAVGALTPWVDAGVLGPLEVHATEAIVRIGAGSDAPAASTDVVLALALAMWAPLHGHACIDLADAPAIVAAGTASDATPTTTPTQPPSSRSSTPSRRAGWRRSRPARSCAASPATTTWSWPTAGRSCSTARASTRSGSGRTSAWWSRRSRPAPGRRHSRRRGRAAGTPADPQRLATDAAAHAALTVVVGGPGTGKTFTIARLLAELLAADDGVRIGLAAPTGKAAERMTASIRALAADAGAPAGVTARLVALEAVTLHRLLGWRPGSHTRFHHDAADPLPYDIVVIDETSMVPLPMMARLLEATSAATRLVLVGDPDQLESVEVGAVLGDIVRAEALRPNVFRLERQYRTAVGSPIAELAALIRAGRADDVIALARSGVAGLTYVSQADGAAAVSSGRARRARPRSGCRHHR